MTTSYDIADQFLAALGAPRTPAMERAVAIWLRFESGSNVIGNNPWNLHSGAACPKSQGYCPGNGSLPGQIGNRYAGPGDQNVAVFATMGDGARASAANLQRLSGSGYGYDKVIAAARSGSALGFLKAVQNSSWSAGHYSYIKLVQAWGSPVNYDNQVNVSMPTGADSGSGSSQPGSNLGAWDNLVSFPVGHILTPADVKMIIDKLDAAGYFQGDSPLGGSKAKTTAILMSHVGQAWGKPLQDAISAEFGTAAASATDPITAVGNAIGEVGNTLVRIAGFMIAVAIIIVGIWVYSKGQGEQPVIAEGVGG